MIFLVQEIDIAHKFCFSYKLNSWLNFSDAPEWFRYTSYQLINLSLALDIFFLIAAFKEKVILVRRLHNSDRSGTFHGSLNIIQGFPQISLNLFITILVS